MGGAWGLGLFQSDYDYDIIGEFTLESDVWQLEHVDAMKSGKKPIYMLEMVKSEMYTPETGLGSIQKLRSIQHQRADRPAKAGEVYYSVYAKLSSDANRVRDYMDDEALDRLIYKYLMEASIPQHTKPLWRPGYVVVLLGACAMTLGCTLSATFLEYLRKTYADPQQVGLMRDALVQMRKALSGPNGYVNGEPYDFGTTGLDATVSAGGAPKEDRIVPWQVNVPSPDGETPWLMLLMGALSGNMEVNCRKVSKDEFGEGQEQLNEPVEEKQEEPEEEQGRCQGCKAEKRVGGLPLLACAKCKMVWYCSKDCQEKCWKGHKELCKWVVTSKAMAKKESAPPGSLTAEFLEELAMMKIRSMPWR